jgi:hypothetical protein
VIVSDYFSSISLGGLCRFFSSQSNPKMVLQESGGVKNGKTCIRGRLHKPTCRRWISQR